MPAYANPAQGDEKRRCSRLKHADKLYGLSDTLVFWVLCSSTRVYTDPCGVKVPTLKHPCEMDEIMAIARNHGLKVIEDVSHAQGTLYRGRFTGTIGDVGAMSLMSGKSLVVGEGGMLITRDRLLYERAIAFGHYERHNELTDPSLTPFKGYPFDGVKYRINQLASALGRVQLEHYSARIAEIQEAMNCFWDLLDGCPGAKAHRPPPKDSGSTMGGWYASKRLYRAEELGGLNIAIFCRAVTAEGSQTWSGANTPMHLHPLTNDLDIYNCGKPTRLAFVDRDLRQPKGSLPVSERIALAGFAIPHFKRVHKDVIEQYARAFRKVAENADQC